jgi:Domain of unknown function (DUF3576)
MAYRFRVFVGLLPLLLGLSSCGLFASSTPVPPETYAPQNIHQGGGAGTLFGDQGLSLDLSGNSRARSNPGQGAALGVNAYLWRGALDTLSFMPLASADPFGGVIITDWWQPPQTPDERFKATAYILGRELTASALRVSVYRQVRQNGEWVDSTVSPATVADIENRVLDRARTLRAESGTP